MTKRLFDAIFACLMLIPLFPVIVVVSILILVKEGRPIFYLSERMKTANDSFTLVKFRTMSGDAKNLGVTGGDKSSRVSSFQANLRRFRLDEIPQLLNIIAGDMSFVGPRPPLRQYVRSHPDVYAQVLKSQPGVTGLATLMMHRYEERLLSGSRDANETDEIYRNQIIPRKARLDLIYQKNSSVCFDMKILYLTFVSLMR